MIRNFTTQPWQRRLVHAELDQILVGLVPEDGATVVRAAHYQHVDSRLLQRLVSVAEFDSASAERS